MRKKALLLTVCLIASAPAHAKERVFALVPKATNNVFFEAAAEGCRKAAAELHVRCDYIGPSKVDAAEQVQILQDLITRRVDGIAVAGVDSATLVGPLKAAKAAGIPVVTFDSDLLEKDRALRATYIGTNNYAIGENEAKKLQELHPSGGGTICIQTNTPGEANLNERVRGLRETLSGRKNTGGMGERLKGENGWYEVDGCPLMNDGDFTVTVKQLDETLAKYPDLTAFMPVGGWAQLFPAGYREVVGRYKERIRSKKTLIITADTLPPQMELVAEGLSHANIGQRPFDMGYKAMGALKNVVEGREVPDPLYTGLDICTPETHATCLQR